MARHVISPEDHPNGEFLGVTRYGSGDSVLVRQGVQWFGRGTTIQGRASEPEGVLDDFSIEIRGGVGGSFAAVDLASQARKVRDAEILVGPTGVVTGLQHALLLDAGSGNRVVNRGEVVAIENAIRAGGGVEIVNQGYLGTVGAYYMEASRYHAISITSGAAQIHNAGFIEGVDEGLADDRQAAVAIAPDARLELSNGPEATISARGGTAILGGDRDDAVVNAGRIAGEVALRGGGDVVMNGGALAGSLMTGSGDDVVIHQGVARGRISLGDGDDLFEAGPTSVARLVAGGPGNDTYVLALGSRVRILEEAGRGTDTILSHSHVAAVASVERMVLLGGADTRATGNAGDNAIRGNVGANLLDGRAGDDGIVGGAGDDRVRGGGGRDRLSGQDGDDRLDGEDGGDRVSGGDGADRVGGGDGADELLGGSGDDRLLGGRGDDRLVGGRGSDELVGGRGADQLWSGRGADVFVWRHAEDAGAQQGARDVVRGFDPARDTLRFDLGLAYQEGRFSGERAEVRLVETGGDTAVQVDADGDGAGDMTIVLRGVTGLGEGVLAL